jgi:hypothetical protein
MESNTEAEYRELESHTGECIDAMDVAGMTNILIIDGLEVPDQSMSWQFRGYAHLTELTDSL